MKVELLGWVVGLVVLFGALSWLRPSPQQRVSQLIRQVQRGKANTSPPLGLVHGVLRQGTSGISLLLKELEVGERPRRVAIEALLRDVYPRAPVIWQQAFREKLRQAMDHSDWRVREVVLGLLLDLPGSLAQRVALFREALQDDHPYIRFLAAQRLVKEKRPVTQLFGLLTKLMETGKAGGGSGSHDSHAHGSHDHSGHPHHTKDIKEHLRHRLSCRIDRDDDWLIRHHVVQGISKWQVPVHRLVSLARLGLRDKHKAVREEALRQLVRLGAKALPSLTLAYRDAPVQKKRHLAWVMGEIGAPSWPILWRLFQAPQASHWYAAHKGLEAIKRPPPALISKVCEAVKSVGHDRRATLFGLLAQYATRAPRALACLQHSLSHQQLGLQIEAARAMGVLAARVCRGGDKPGKPRGSLCFPLAQILTPLLLTSLQQLWASSSRAHFEGPMPPSSQPTTQRASPRLVSEHLWALSQLGAKGRRALPWLEAQMRLCLQKKASCGETQVLGMWWHTMAALGGQKVRPRRRLISMLALASEEALSRVMEVWSQRGAWRSEVPELLLFGRCLCGQKRRLRRGCRRALLRHLPADVAFLGFLGPWLSAPNVCKRRAATALLSRWKPPTKGAKVATLRRKKLLQALAYRCVYDVSRQVQELSALAILRLTEMGWMGLSVKQWNQLVRHPHWRVKVSIAKALGTLPVHIKAPKRLAFVTSALLRILVDPKRQVRRAAAKALGELGAAGLSAIPALYQTLKDHAIDVQHAARGSLARLRMIEKKRKRRGP